ncbi:MAG: TerC family protein [Acidobacteriota bacterium]|nr:TerC family protein [Acidobacteriota bacterium]
MNRLSVWVYFNLFVLTLLAADLVIFRRRAARTTNVKEALTWSAGWVGLAAAFAVLLFFWQGQKTTLEFVTGYVIELSLSVDNLFVFLLIFRYFKVYGAHQHKVLFWGILGALVLRGLFIILGVGLIHRFHWITYVFGVLLVYSGAKLFRNQHLAIDIERNPLLTVFRKLLPVTENYEGNNFFVRKPKLLVTPLFLVLLVVETTDLLFAVDSIPAILAITLNSFVVYSSNVFAMLGLRSMYFALAGMLDRFRYLHYGLSLVLIFIGAKMLLAKYYEVPTVWALGSVALILFVAVVTSQLHAEPAKP